jgi:hypothetical protein
MAQKAIGPSLGRKRPWGASARRERRKHAFSYLVQSFAYFTKPIRFLETHDPYCRRSNTGRRVQCRSGRRSRFASVCAGTRQRLHTTARGGVRRLGGRCTLTSCFMRLSRMFSPCAMVS